MKHPVIHGSLRYDRIAQQKKAALLPAQCGWKDAAHQRSDMKGGSAAIYVKLAHRRRDELWRQ